jgi:hypothetical protein
MERAAFIDPAEAAAEAIKAFVRMNRTQLAADGELLAMLLPDRFRDCEIRDLQRHVIEQLVRENAALRAECSGLKSRQGIGEAVRNLLLELLDARTFEEAVGFAVGSPVAFGADLAGICIEGEACRAVAGAQRVRLVAPGLVARMLGRDGSGVILSNGGEVLLGPAGRDCKSLAVFRLRLGIDAPAAVFVLGARAPFCFEGEESSAEIGYFARALERTIRAWLDLPKR